jgi:protein required for attachment to host cells
MTQVNVSATPAGFSRDAASSRSRRESPMTDAPRLPHDALVLVGDGRRALVLRNRGTPAAPDLAVEHAWRGPPNPATRDQGTDAPGRGFDPTGHRSAMEQRDWHDMAEEAFAKDVATALEALCARGDHAGLVVVAPPRCLADLRQAYGQATRAALLGEIDKDLTRHPVPQIARHLAMD